MVFSGKRSLTTVLAAIVISFAGSGPREAERGISQPLAFQRELIPYRVTHDGSTIDIGPAIPLPVEGMPQQLWASASPDDPERLLVCTFEADPAHAQLLSAAYVSLDGGNTWMR